MGLSWQSIVQQARNKNVRRARLPLSSKSLRGPWVNRRQRGLKAEGETHGGTRPGILRPGILRGAMRVTSLHTAAVTCPTDLNGRSLHYKSKPRNMCCGILSLRLQACNFRTVIYCLCRVFGGSVGSGNVWLRLPYHISASAWVNEIICGHM